MSDKTNIDRIVLETSGDYFRVGYNCTKIQSLCDEYPDHIDRQFDIMDGEKTIASVINCPVVVYYQ